MKIYPLESTETLFQKEKQTFADIGVKINPCLEGIKITPELIQQKTRDGLRKLISLEFNWLPATVVEQFNQASGEEERHKILVDKVYGNCKLNCQGCYVKQDKLYEGKKLVHPEKIMNLIQEAVDHLGTITIKYLGPTEFFRDKDVFKYLDRLAKMKVIFSVFAKDPMFGSDQEVDDFFGEQGIHTAEEFVKKLASYSNLRILFHFASFDDAKTNLLVRDGYSGKNNYIGDYKTVQTRAVQLLYRYFVKEELEKNRAGRLVVINSMINPETINEAMEIFKYFFDRGVPVCSTTYMQSGCGSKIYTGLDNNFLEKLAEFYAQAIKHSLKRGLINAKDLALNGPSPYAGVDYCIQLCNGLLIRETGQLMRCPGADHADWQEDISTNDLLKRGLVWAWPLTKNYQQKAELNIGCLAKPKIFTPEFNQRIMEIYKELK